jgi:glutamate formiminotransferase/formiminotetrahydrofolate cyclodeaminase
MAGFGRPPGSDDEKRVQKAAVEAATRGAIEVPLRVMQVALESMAVIEAMARGGMESSISDAGVGALCARSAVMGAYLNVRINAGQLTDKDAARGYVERGAGLQAQALEMEAEILQRVEERL